MTPQAFSYPIVANNGMIYVPPFGLEQSLDYMLKFNPMDRSFTKIKLEVDDCNAKWIWGTAWRNKIVVLPYNESNRLVKLFQMLQFQVGQCKRHICATGAKESHWQGVSLWRRRVKIFRPTLLSS